MTTELHPNRNLRQRQIIPPEKLARCHGLVIGVGAIGRQVALQLAAVGIPALDLIDFDRVGEENLAPQAYWPEDLGQLKVEATARLCRSINPQVRIQSYPERFRRSFARTLPSLSDPASQSIVFACVDSMSGRGLIWEAVKDKAAFYADGRMAAEVIRVLAADRPRTDAHYASTLFGEEEAYAGSCTARSTVYTASIAAGLMLSSFTRWLRGMPVEADLTLNLLSMELSCA